MKKKPANIELVKDDEILREEAMCDGPIKILNGIILRPIVAQTVSWMQRNEVISSDKDMIWKAAAFAFLHSAPMPEIRAVVNDRVAFVDAVDSWIGENMSHHSQAVEISSTMNTAFSRYAATASEVLGPKGSAPGN
jgi:hypothetical protein